MKDQSDNQPPPPSPDPTARPERFLFTDFTGFDFGAETPDDLPPDVPYGGTAGDLASQEGLVSEEDVDSAFRGGNVGDDGRSGRETLTADNAPPVMPQSLQPMQLPQIPPLSQLPSGHSSGSIGKRIPEASRTVADLRRIVIPDGRDDEPADRGGALFVEEEVGAGAEEGREAESRTDETLSNESAFLFLRDSADFDGDTLLAVPYVSADMVPDLPPDSLPDPTVDEPAAQPERITVSYGNEGDVREEDAAQTETLVEPPLVPLKFTSAKPTAPLAPVAQTASERPRKAPDAAADLAKLFPYDLPWNPAGAATPGSGSPVSAEDVGREPAHVARSISVRREAPVEKSFLASLPESEPELAYDNLSFSIPPLIEEIGIEFEPDEGDVQPARMPRRPGHLPPSSAQEAASPRWRSGSADGDEAFSPMEGTDDILQWTADLVAVPPDGFAAALPGSRPAQDRRFPVSSGAEDQMFSPVPETVVAGSGGGHSDWRGRSGGPDTLRYDAATVVGPGRSLPRDLDFGREEELPAVPMARAAEMDSVGLSLERDQVADVLNELHGQDAAVAVAEGEDELLTGESVNLPEFPAALGREMGMADTQIGPSPLLGMSFDGPEGGLRGFREPGASFAEDTVETMVGMPRSGGGALADLPEMEMPGDAMNNALADLSAASLLDQASSLNLPDFGAAPLASGEALPEGALADLLKPGNFQASSADDDLGDLDLLSAPPPVLPGSPAAKDSGLVFGSHGAEKTLDEPDDTISNLGQGLSANDLQAAFSADALENTKDDFSGLLGSIGDGLPDDLFAVPFDEAKDGENGGMAAAPARPLTLKERLVALALGGLRRLTGRLEGVWGFMDVRKNWWIYCDGVAVIIITISSAAILSWFLWYRS